jgi:hypothetical protein
MFPGNEFYRGNRMYKPVASRDRAFLLPLKEESAAAVPSPFLADTFTVF